MPSPLSTVGNNGSPRRKRIPSILPGQFSGFPYPGSTAPWTEPARRSLSDRLACHPELRLLRRGSMLAACTCGGKALDMVKEHPRGTGSVPTSRHVSASPGDSGMPPQRPSLRRGCLTQAGPQCRRSAIRCVREFRFLAGSVYSQAFPAWKSRRGAPSAPGFSNPGHTMRPSRLWNGAQGMNDFRRLGSERALVPRPLPAGTSNTSNQLRQWAGGRELARLQDVSLPTSIPQARRGRAPRRVPRQAQGFLGNSWEAAQAGTAAADFPHHPGIDAASGSTRQGSPRILPGG